MPKKPTPKPKPPKVAPEEAAKASLQALKAKLDNLGRAIDKMLVSMGEVKLPEVGEAPNRPEQHESVRAVAGQAPRI